MVGGGAASGGATLGVCLHQCNEEGWPRLGKGWGVAAALVRLRGGRDASCLGCSCGALRLHLWVDGA